MSRLRLFGLVLLGACAVDGTPDSVVYDNFDEVPWTGTVPVSLEDSINGVECTDYATCCRHAGAALASTVSEWEEIRDTVLGGREPAGLTFNTNNEMLLLGWVSACPSKTIALDVLGVTSRAGDLVLQMERLDATYLDEETSRPFVLLRLPKRNIIRQVRASLDEISGPVIPDLQPEESTEPTETGN